MMKNKFDINDGLDIQKGQMSLWENVLKPSTFEMLQERINEENNKIDWSVDTGHDVFRGVDIDSVVHNLAANYPYKNHEAYMASL